MNCKFVMLYISTVNYASDHEDTKIRKSKFSSKISWDKLEFCYKCYKLAVYSNMEAHDFVFIWGDH